MGCSDDSTIPGAEKGQGYVWLSPSYGTDKGRGIQLPLEPKLIDLLPLVVCESDALARHLEVHNTGRRTRRGTQSADGCLGYGLWTCQRFCFHGAQIQHAAGWGGSEQGRE